jgi:hypothetical protein
MSGQVGTHGKCQAAPDSSAYVRFIILSGARTGSHMLAQALNFSSSITCFREVFNTDLPMVQYGVEGYDNSSQEDMELRAAEPVRFLHERIFCEYPREIRAVGFKFHYGHQWGSPGILEELLADKDLRVLDLRRRNMLRMLVSLRLAQETGVWLQEGRPPRIRNVLRHPLKVTHRYLRKLQGVKPDQQGRDIRLRVSPEDLSTFIAQTEFRITRFAELFAEHPTLTVSYEQAVDHPEEAFARAQSFLGLEPQPLTVATRRQNPEPLRELIENYDELYEAFKDTPCEAFFE